MPVESLKPPATPSNLPRSKSLFSRFTTPLTNRNKSISDFHIETDDPWRLYGPGDTVTGCVALTVSKSTRITHLLVCLHGFAKVFKNHVAPGEGYGEVGLVSSGRGQRGEEYLGNGLMSLFDDEIVLCGEGRLKEGVYKFKFELQLPSKTLPSSIDFERGMICYQITSTLTRPTTIAPLLTCERKIHFQGVIDIASLPPQQPKYISLEPVTRRGRARTKIKARSVESSLPTRSPNLSRANTETNVSIHSGQEPAEPQSPTASDISRSSIATDSSNGLNLVQRPSLASGSLRSSDLRSSSSSTAEGSIKATIQLPRPGALPGDVIPVKISIKHTKAMRGLIIVTLYRQGRIDLHPAVPTGPPSKGKKPEHEDVFPRSKTGLGGLHFASGSPSSVFRKDLSQSTALMIVNPHTLEAEIKASLRVPEDVFPTISDVPGGMIDFQYHIEVVLDLCGRLSESNFLSRLSITTPPHTFTSSGSHDPGSNVASTWNDQILDTAQLKRVKMVASCQFTIVIGSKDSNRTAKRWNDGEQNHEPQTDHQSGDDANYGYGYGYDYGYEWTEEDYRAYYGDQYLDRSVWQNGSYLQDHPTETLIPPPETDEEVDEKTRLRRAEELLLPSEPPQQEESGPSSSSTANVVTDASAPSAPYLPDEAELYSYRGSNDGSDDHHNGDTLASTVSAHSVDTIVPANSLSEPPPFIPENGPPHSSIDDKQDLERQRLLALASAPPNDDEGHLTASSSGEGTGQSDHPEMIPTAPMLTAEDEFGVSTVEHVTEHLPEYRR